MTEKEQYKLIGKRHIVFINDEIYIFDAEIVKDGKIIGSTVYPKMIQNVLVSNEKIFKEFQYYDELNKDIIVKIKEEYPEFFI